MDLFMWFVLGAIFLLVVMVVLILTGKGDFLLFGRKRDTKEAYHVKRVRLVYGLAFGVVAGLMAYLALYGRQMDPGLRSWWGAINAVVLLIASILRRTVCKK